MAPSKTDLKRRAQKKADLEGTRVPTTKGGVPLKPPKEQIQCTSCKAMLEKRQVHQLKLHHEAKHDKLPFSQCFPGVAV